MDHSPTHLVVMQHIGDFVAGQEEPAPVEMKALLQPPIGFMQDTTLGVRLVNIMASPTTVYYPFPREACYVTFARQVKDPTTGLWGPHTDVRRMSISAPRPADPDDRPEYDWTRIPLWELGVSPAGDYVGCGSSKALSNNPDIQPGNIMASFMAFWLDDRFWVYCLGLPDRAPTRMEVAVSLDPLTGKLGLTNMNPENIFTMWLEAPIVAAAAGLNTNEPLTAPPSRTVWAPNVPVFPTHFFLELHGVNANSSVSVANADIKHQSSYPSKDILAVVPTFPKHSLPVFDSDAIVELPLEVSQHIGSLTVRMVSCYGNTVRLRGDMTVLLCLRRIPSPTGATTIRPMGKPQRFG